MADIAEGKRPAGIVVKEGKQTAEILPSGILSVSLPGLAIASECTLRVIKAGRLK